MTTRVFVAGLGNFTHPNTLHSYGQVLLENLCLKAASVSGRRDSQLQLRTQQKGYGGWMQQYTLPFSDQPDKSFELFLFKPKALMNINGPPIVKCAREVCDWRQRTPKDLPNLIALHDEIELPVGKLRVKSSGSTKGHRGLESLAVALSTRNFTRMGLGVDRPKERTKMAVSSHVLSALTRTHLDLVHFDPETQRGGLLLDEAWTAIQQIALESLLRQETAASRHTSQGNGAQESTDAPNMSTQPSDG